MIMKPFWGDFRMFLGCFGDNDCNVAALQPGVVPKGENSRLITLIYMFQIIDNIYFESGGFLQSFPKSKYLR